MLVFLMKIGGEIICWEKTLREVYRCISGHRNSGFGRHPERHPGRVWGNRKLDNCEWSTFTIFVITKWIFFLVHFISCLNHYIFTTFLPFWVRIRNNHYKNIFVNNMIFFLQIKKRTLTYYEVYASLYHYSEDNDILILFWDNLCFYTLK